MHFKFKRSGLGLVQGSQPSSNAILYVTATSKCIEHNISSVIHLSTCHATRVIDPVVGQAQLLGH